MNKMNAFRTSVIVTKNKYYGLVNENDEDDKLSADIILNALPMRKGIQNDPRGRFPTSPGITGL